MFFMNIVFPTPFNPVTFCPYFDICHYSLCLAPACRLSVERNQARPVARRAVRILRTSRLNAVCPAGMDDGSSGLCKVRIGSSGAEREFVAGPQNSPG